MEIRIDIGGLSQAQIEAIAAALQDGRMLHARMAAGAEKFIKAVGPKIAEGKHSTAESLGGKRTKHLDRAYQAIETTSDETAANLWVPRDTRLRAGFGDFAVNAKPGKFLTIPATGEAYGRKARDFADLFFIRPKKGGLFLVRKRGKRGKQAGSTSKRRRVRREERVKHIGIQVMFRLVKRAAFQGDESLLPMAEITDAAVMGAEEWIDARIAETLSSGGNGGQP